MQIMMYFVYRKDHLQRCQGVIGSLDQDQDQRAEHLKEKKVDLDPILGLHGGDITVEKADLSLGPGLNLKGVTTIGGDKCHLNLNQDYRLEVEQLKGDQC